jgi:hypothetical protein
MARGVSLSLDEFAGKLYLYGKVASERQIKAFEAGKRQVYRVLIRASSEAAGGDRVLSRVGKATGFGTRKGSRLGFKMIDDSKTSVTFKKIGAWQFVDNSVTSGSTKPHSIAPDPKRNKRPLPPATRYRPSMRAAAAGPFGGFIGNGGAVMHPGSARFPYWGRAIKSIQSKVVESHKDEFTKAGRQVFAEG